MAFRRDKIKREEIIVGNETKGQEGCPGIFRRVGYFRHFEVASRNVRLRSRRVLRRLGQGENLKAIKAKGLALGASKVYVEDLREVFVKDHVFPMLRGNAVYEGTYLLGTSIARPLIARRQIEIAPKEGAEAVCHGVDRQGQRPGSL